MNITLENQEKPNYRKLAGLNFSSIKVFDTDPIKFYKEFILGEGKDDKTSYSLTIGDLVDFYLLECQGNETIFNIEFDKHFAMYEGVKSTAQAFLLADELFNLTKRDMEDGVIITPFENRFKEAFDSLQSQGKYKGKTWEKGLEDFTKVAKDYFDKLVENVNKKTVTLGDVEKAKSIVHVLINDDFTRDIFNNNALVRKQILEFKYNGFDCKGEVDFMILDDVNMIIQPYDLKTTYDNEEFDYGYLKNSYYLQQAYYTIGLQQVFPGYEILPFKFVVADTSANNRRPLVYELDRNHFEQGMKGFMYNNYKYRGIEELVSAISWANDNGIWNVSKENHDNNGKVKLKNYGSNSSLSV